MSIFVAGNSHTIALALAARQFKDATAHVKFFGFGTGHTETTSFSRLIGRNIEFTDPTYTKNLLKWTKEASIDSTNVWALVMGTHTTRILRGPFWKNSAPPASWKVGMRPVSSGMLRQIAKDDQKYVCTFMGQMKEIGARFLVVSCPPIRRDGELIRSGIPIDVASEVDNASRQYFIDWLKERRIPFVSPPPEVYDSDGLLKQQYSSSEKLSDGSLDPHHANPAYGALMLERVLAAISENFPDSINQGA